MNAAKCIEIVCSNVTPQEGEATGEVNSLTHWLCMSYRKVEVVIGDGEAFRKASD